MSRRRRQQSEAEPTAPGPAPGDYVEACVEGATEIVDAVRPAAGYDVFTGTIVADPPSVESLRAEYDRLAAQVTKAKPTDPGYKELREAKRLAFAAWHTAANP